MDNGYSKIKPPSKTKSRSIDYSDLSSLPHDSLKPKPNKLNQEDDNSGIGGAALKRNSSVSSSSTTTSSYGIHSAVKRAMSMRRSSSVAERYCRIHDQFLSVSSPIDDDEENERSLKKKKNRGGKIFKACKKLFGL